MTKPDLNAFFTHALDLLFIADTDGTFQRVNPAFTEVLGYSEKDLLSKKLTDLVHPEELKDAVAALDRLQRGERIRGFETRVECNDGSIRWLSWRATLDDEGERIYGSAHEITEQKEIDRLKDEFVSVVSHELRTPLTSIRGSIGLALNADEELSAQTKRMLEIAEQNSERLELLVDDILDIEKIESGDIDFEPQSVDPRDVIREVVEGNGSFAEQYDVALGTQFALDGQRISVDPDRLFQILTNFTSNAIKYSPEGGTVTLAAQPMSDGDAVRISVTDHGDGIPEAFRDQIFEPFTQADASTTRQRQGTGLGLSIARALTEQMGGDIDFVTEVGEGTTFFVDFPVEDGEW